ncbi:vWA domain-containing protein [Niveispirillum irakense]|uniref:vWA domain-containing protein n=1 Tax=Niveispirillum irakense TaxID=34011 RepID=UPI000409489C|nr:vWA domain-containing protein [Niveispirillum irakense]
MSRYLRPLLVMLFLVWPSVPPAIAAYQPLTVEGVPGLSQRVLTRPNARLLPAAGGTGGTVLDVFSHFYVFERRDVGGQVWLQVGPDARRAPTGWIAEMATVPWKQAVVLAFNQTVRRPPALFFQDRASLDRVLGDTARAERVANLLSQARVGRIDPGTGLAAMEPQGRVPDFASRFYMLPILDWQNVTVPNTPPSRRDRKVLEVATLVAPGNPSAPPPPDPEALRNMRYGVVFVIDTTKSMQPYIDRTRQMVRSIVGQLRNSPAGNRISFGLVGYRDSLRDRPGLDYVSKVFHPLERSFNAGAFQSAIDGMKEASVSSVGFAEDGIAGVNTALAMPGWDDFGARFIVLITDAPVRGAGDDRSETGMEPDHIATKAGAQDRLTAIFTILLKTPEGQEYHRRAEMQLDKLARFNPTGRSYFHPVADGDVDRFGTVIDGIGRDVLAIGELAASGRTAQADSTRQGGQQVAEAGYAMQLAWLANQRNQTAPEIQRGWTADFDMADPQARGAFDIHVLLTRAQLNQLYQALGAIEKAATARLDAPGGRDSFFTLLRQVLATAQSDPASLDSLDGGLSARLPGDSELTSMKDMVKSIVTALPYNSPILRHTPETLNALSPTLIHDMLNNIRGLRSLYREFFRDEGRWISLNAGAGIDERVYPLPLDLLP